MTKSKVVQVNTDNKYSEAVRLLGVVRRKFGGLLLVSYEDDYRRDEKNLRVKIDEALAAIKESEGRE